MISIDEETVVGIYPNPFGNLTDVLPVNADVFVKFSILNESVSPGCIFVASNLVEPDGNDTVKKLPILQSILAVFDETVIGNTCPLTLPENTSFPLNVLLPVVA